MSGLTDRIERLRFQSLELAPYICGERALIVTNFYKSIGTEHSTCVKRALAFKDVCAKKTINIGNDELIVGDRASLPKGASTYPEISCHTVDDLKTLRTRNKTSYRVSEKLLASYQAEVIPFWEGKSLRDKAFDALTPDWREAYSAGVFTEFLEQRSPGHTVADGKIYRHGFLDFKQEIAQRATQLKSSKKANNWNHLEQLKAMDIACDAIIILAGRYAEKATEMAAMESNMVRRNELKLIAKTCSNVPARAPTSFMEALQMYWFVHLGVVLELNGWDAFSPGHLDQHLLPFYLQDTRTNKLTRDQAKELICCLWLKFNNQPAPPKVGVTAAESGTYNDFVNINLGGLLRGGADGSNEVSHLILDVVDAMPLLQPGTNIQLSDNTNDEFLLHACQVIKKGYGFPSVFNADGIVEQMKRVGKKVSDARGGGSSGCVETGCFGKEAYILTGYFNLPKVLEITLHNGNDPATGKSIGPKTGDPNSFRDVNDLTRAFDHQLRHFVDVKMSGNNVFEELYATEVQAPFLSVLIDDCIENAVDYNAGGARYNTRYFQGVGIGTITDSIHAIKKHVFDEGTITMVELINAIDRDFEDAGLLKMRLVNTPDRFGNDNDETDSIMKRVFDLFFEAVEGKVGTRGGSYHIVMLPTTCHIYFGSKCIASPDGRMSGTPLSEGISPVQGSDLKGPTAVLGSAAKMEHVKTGGTLLNLKLMPDSLKGEEGKKRLAHLVRAYFKMGGHHVQFNVVDEETLRLAQQDPAAHRNLMVRVAGYSDYFCDLKTELQNEIISRTAHGS